MSNDEPKTKGQTEFKKETDVDSDGIETSLTLKKT